MLRLVREEDLDWLVDMAYEMAEEYPYLAVRYAEIIAQYYSQN